MRESERRVATDIYMMHNHTYYILYLDVLQYIHERALTVHTKKK
jgi:hypothetical protein